MRVVLVIIGLACINSAIAQSDFQIIKNRVREAWSNGEHQMAIDLLNSVNDSTIKKRDLHTKIYYKSLLHLETGEYGQSLSTFREGFTEGFFFHFWSKHRSALFSHTVGKRILSSNDSIRFEYLNNSKVEYAVLLPENYNTKGKYPLLYFLHGNNSNLTSLKKVWHDVVRPDHYIIVLAQSPYARSNFTFDWVDSLSSQTAIKKIHDKILAEYKVDSSNVIISGFSNGGRMAIDIHISQILSTKAFIAFHPSMPKNYQFSRPSRSKKGAILTGENDYMLKEQIKMADHFYENSYELNLVVLPNHGHDYPKTFSDEIKRMIEWIN